MKAFSCDLIQLMSTNFDIPQQEKNNKINKLHERCLQLLYSDNTSSFEELLETDNSVSVCYRNTQVFSTELYKIVNKLSPKIIKEVFPLNENATFYTRNKIKFYLRDVKSVTFGSETLSHVTLKIWELVPVEIKNAESVACFERATEKLKPMICPCRLCRTYVSQVGFV